MTVAVMVTMLPSDHDSDSDMTVPDHDSVNDGDMLLSDHDSASDGDDVATLTAVAVHTEMLIQARARDVVSTCFPGQQLCARTNGQTDRQTDRQTDFQTDRQTDR